MYIVFCLNIYLYTFPTFLFGCRQDVEVEDAVHHDVFLDLLVKLPVPDNDCLEVIADTAVFPCKGGGQVWRESQSEGDEVVARGQVRTRVDNNLLLQVILNQIYPTLLASKETHCRYIEYKNMMEISSSELR